MFRELIQAHSAKGLARKLRVSALGAMPIFAIALLSVLARLASACFGALAVI